MRRSAFGLAALLFLIASAPNARPAITTVRWENAYLGVQINPDQNAVEILAVRPGTPAETAGLKAGDRIVGIGDRDVSSIDALSEMIGSHDPGDRVTLKIRRGDRTMNVDVVLGSRDEPAEIEIIEEVPEVEPSPLPDEPMLETPSSEAPRRGGFLGVTIEADDDGVAIADVRPGSPAEKGKLKAGDRIVAIDDHAIGSIEDLTSFLGTTTPGMTVSVKVERDGSERTRKVTLGQFGDVAWAGPAAEAPVAPRVAPPAAVLRPAPAAEPSPAKERGWLGIYFEMDDDGIRVSDTVAEGPAQTAGIEAGDVLVAIDGGKIESTDQLVEKLTTAGAGTQVSVTVMRGDRPMEFDVRLGSNPNAVVSAAPSEPERAARAEAEAAKQDADRARKRSEVARAQAETRRAQAEARREQVRTERERARAHAEALRERVAERVQEPREKVAPKAKAMQDAPRRRARVMIAPDAQTGSFRVEESGDGKTVLRSADGRRVIIIHEDGDDVRVEVAEDGAAKKADGDDDDDDDDADDWGEADEDHAVWVEAGGDDDDGDAGVFVLRAGPGAPGASAGQCHGCCHCCCCCQCCGHGAGPAGRMMPRVHAMGGGDRQVIVVRKGKGRATEVPPHAIRIAKPTPKVIEVIDSD